eukprot:1119673_1
MHVNDYCLKNPGPNTYCNLFYFELDEPSTTGSYWPALFVGSNWGPGNNQRLRFHSGTNTASNTKIVSDPETVLEKGSTYHIYISITPENIYIEVNGTGSSYDNNGAGFDRSNYYNRQVQLYLSTGLGTWQSYSAELTNICVRSSSKALIQTQWSESSNYLWLEYGLNTWFGAKLYCEQLNSSLASVQSSEENTELTDLCLSASSLYCFIGLNDLSVEGQYEWVDATIYSYSNWNPGQPEDGGATGVSQDCTVLATGDKTGWHDTWCDKEYNYAFICNAPNNQPVHGTSTPTPTNTTSNAPNNQPVHGTSTPTPTNTTSNAPNNQPVHGTSTPTPTNTTSNAPNNQP